MIDLLVCNYNTKDKIERLLTTLHADFEPGVWKLYIADNGSTDTSADWLRANQDYFDIEQIFYNENIGYSAAINQMAKVSNSEILCAVNADTWFSTSQIKQVQNTFDENPEQSVMGPKQMDENCIIRHGGIVGSNTNLTQRGWGEEDPADEKYKYRQEVPTVSGSIYFIKRSVWEEMATCPVYVNEILEHPSDFQGFLPTFHFYEETFFSYHCRAHGHKIFYDGNITMGHSWAASTGGPKPILREYFLKSQKIFRQACQTHGIEHD